MKKLLFEEIAPDFEVVIQDEAPLGSLRGSFMGSCKSPYEDPSRVPLRAHVQGSLHGYYGVHDVVPFKGHYRVL